MAPKKSAGSPMKSGSPQKDRTAFAEDPVEKAKAYKAYYSTQDADQLRNMCKNQGMDTKGTKAELVERLSNPKKSRARSGSPIGRASHHFNTMTKHEEWMFFAKVVVGLVVVLILALLFHSAGGDTHKFLDFFGTVGQKLKGIFSFGGSAAAAAGGAATKK